MTAPRIPWRRARAIEQAIAFGRSLDWMLENLHVDPSDVDAVLARMDRINKERHHRGPSKPRLPMSAPGVIRHGTAAGYRAHLRQAAPLCDACRDAEADRKRELRSAG